MIIYIDEITKKARFFTRFFCVYILYWRAKEKLVFNIT